MTVIFVVGPSGGGKTTLCRAIANKGNEIIHIDLDKKVAEKLNVEHVSSVPHIFGWTRFWETCTAIFDKLAEQSTNEKIYIVDVGAGALQTSPSIAYFVDRSSKVICVTADPKIVYQHKHAAKGRNEQEFCDTEYSPDRIRIYNAAAKTVDTSRDSVSVSEEKFRQAIHELIAMNHEL